MRALVLATGIAVASTAMVAWMMDHWLLAPFGLDYLRTLALVLVAGALARFACVAFRQPADASAMLIATSAAVIAVVFLEPRPALLATTLQGVVAGTGVGVAMILFAAMRARVEAGDVPAPFRGAPIAMLTAGLMLLALLGFSGISAG